jgi:serine-type D-Ala-D-Ala carboxypeptidase/endopeptidase (penicillin-binding protein 4)
LQVGIAIAASATFASIQWVPASPQAASTAKADAAPGIGTPGAAAEPAIAEAIEPSNPGDPAAGESGSADSVRAISAAPDDPTARTRWLVHELDAVLAAHTALTGAKIGAVAFDLAAGEPLWSHNAEVPMSLASTVKLFTASAALRALGPGFVWRTALYGDSPSEKNATTVDNHPEVIDTLYLRGRGDPTLDLAALRTLAVDLADLGIRRISKQIIIDSRYFDDAIEPPRFADQPKEQAAFRAPISALSINRNAVTVVIATAPGDPGTPVVRLDPPVEDYVKVITDQLVATPDGKTRIRLDVTPKKDVLELKITGQISSAGRPFYRRIRIDDPFAFAVAALRMALAERGIRTPARASSGEVPPTARLLVSFDSPPLSEIIYRMNKFSDNFLAEMIFKTMGAQQRLIAGPATWSDAAAAMQGYLDTLRLPGPIRIDNGSGLFDASSASANQLVAVLRSSYQDFRIAPDFIASLPIAAVDGTLRSRFGGGRAAAGLVRAKTGTLSSVSTLAGYVGPNLANLIAFAVLANEIQPTQRAEVRALQEDLVEVLARYLGASVQLPLGTALPAAAPEPPGKSSAVPAKIP